MLGNQGGQGGGEGGKGGKPPVPSALTKPGASLTEAIKTGQARAAAAGAAAAGRGDRASVEAAELARQRAEHEYLTKLGSIREEDAASAGADAKEVTRFARFVADLKGAAKAVDERTLERFRDYLATCCVEDELETGEKIRREDVPSKDFWDRLEAKRKELKTQKREEKVRGAGVRVSLAQQLRGVNDVLAAGAEAAAATRGEAGRARGESAAADAAREKDVLFYRHLFVLVAKERAKTWKGRLSSFATWVGESRVGTAVGSAASAASRRVSGAMSEAMSGAKKGFADVTSRARGESTTGRERAVSTSSGGEAKPAVSGPIPNSVQRMSYQQRDGGITGVPRKFGAPTVTARDAAARVAGGGRGEAVHTASSKEARSRSGSDDASARAGAIDRARAAGQAAAAQGSGSPKAKGAAGGGFTGAKSAGAKPAAARPASRPRPGGNKGGTETESDSDMDLL